MRTQSILIVSVGMVVAAPMGNATVSIGRFHSPAIATGSIALADTVRHSNDAIASAFNAPTLGRPYLEVGSDQLEEVGTITEARVLPDQRIIILDAAVDAIHVFDASGNYVSTWGSKGQGPEQFIGVSVLDLVHDSVVVIDHAGYRATVIRRDGRFIRRIVPPSGLAIHALLSDKQMLATRSEQRRATDQDRPDTLFANIVLLDSTGRTMASPGRYIEQLATLRSSPQMQTMVRLPYSPQGNVTASRQLVAFTDGLSFDINVVDPTTGQIRVISFDTPVTSIDDREHNILIEAALERFPATQRPGIRQLWRRQPRLSTAGSFLRMMFSPAGHLWLGLASSPAVRLGGAGTQHWLIITPEGRVVSALSLLPRERLRSVSDSSVMVTIPNADGLESLRLYKLPHSLRAQRQKR